MLGPRHDLSGTVFQLKLQARTQDGAPLHSYDAMCAIRDTDIVRNARSIRCWRAIPPLIYDQPHQHFNSNFSPNIGMPPRSVLCLPVQAQSCGGPSCSPLPCSFAAVSRWCPATVTSKVAPSSMAPPTYVSGPGGLATPIAQPTNDPMTCMHAGRHWSLAAGSQPRPLPCLLANVARHVLLRQW